MCAVVVLRVSDSVDFNTKVHCFKSSGDGISGGREWCHFTPLYPTTRELSIEFINDELKNNLLALLEKLINTHLSFIALSWNVSGSKLKYLCIPENNIASASCLEFS